MVDFSSFLIAAPSSGSGKTTITLGLLRALKNRGYKVQPFKCGPDYIDTKYHDIASAAKSVNLDLFLSSKGHVRDLYANYSYQKEICIVEGVMGLFDGYDKMKGSSAEIAEVLNLPVILVVNASSSAYSVAPLLFGFKNFYKGLNLAGVIFNYVGSESHYHYLKQACDDVGLRSLGYLPKSKEIVIPSRHLGLSLDNELVLSEFADKAAFLIEKHIYLDELIVATRCQPPPAPAERVASFSYKIAVAFDEAFNFVYHQNIEYLKRIGEVTYFSPLKDKDLPKADLIYIPGGYPELYLDQLGENRELHQNIREYAQNGGKIIAECGGMLYLSSSITNQEGQEYQMVGIFDQKATMEKMKLRLGYRQFHYNGLDIRGHEFHYSHTNENLISVTQQYSAKNTPVETKLLRYKNVIAGYTHIYWAEMDNLFDLFN